MDRNKARMEMDKNIENNKKLRKKRKTAKRIWRLKQDSS